MRKWISWDADVVDAVEKHRNGETQDGEALRLDFVGGGWVSKSPAPGAEWALAGPRAIRVPTAGLSPLQLVQFGEFVANIPESWSCDASFLEYEENGVKYIEVRIYPD